MGVSIIGKKGKGGGGQVRKEKKWLLLLVVGALDLLPFFFYLKTGFWI